MICFVHAIRAGTDSSLSHKIMEEVASRTSTFLVVALLDYETMQVLLPKSENY